MYLKRFLQKEPDTDSQYNSELNSDDEDYDNDASTWQKASPIYYPTLSSALEDSQGKSGSREALQPAQQHSTRAVKQPPTSTLSGMGRSRRMTDSAVISKYVMNDSSEGDDLEGDDALRLLVAQVKRILAVSSRDGDIIGEEGPGPFEDFADAVNGSERIESAKKEFADAILDLDPVDQEAIQAALHKVLSEYVNVAWDKMTKFHANARSCAIAEQVFKERQAEAEERKACWGRLQYHAMKEVLNLRERLDDVRTECCTQEMIEEIEMWEPFNDLDTQTRRLVQACAEEKLKGYVLRIHDLEKKLAVESQKNCGLVERLTSALTSSSQLSESVIAAILQDNQLGSDLPPKAQTSSPSSISRKKSRGPIRPAGCPLASTGGRSPLETRVTASSQPSKPDEWMVKVTVLRKHGVPDNDIIDIFGIDAKLLKSYSVRLDNSRSKQESGDSTEKVCEGGVVHDQADTSAKVEQDVFDAEPNRNSHEVEQQEDVRIQSPASSQETPMLDAKLKREQQSRSLFGSPYWCEIRAGERLSIRSTSKASTVRYDGCGDDCLSEASAWAPLDVHFPGMDRQESPNNRSVQRQNSISHGKSGVGWRRLSRRPSIDDCSDASLLPSRLPPDGALSPVPAAKFAVLGSKASMGGNESRTSSKESVVVDRGRTSSKESAIFDRGDAHPCTLPISLGSKASPRGSIKTGGEVVKRNSFSSTAKRWFLPGQGRVGSKSSTKVDEALFSDNLFQPRPQDAADPRVFGS